MGYQPGSMCSNLIIDISGSETKDAYICMDCKGGNPATAPGVGGNSPWKNSWL